jgi:hypothetical protein
MKAKLKLDKDSLQQFFLENVEKIVFGVVALGALFLIWDALTRKGYDKRPEELNRKSAEADDKINKTPPDRIPPECHSAEFEKLVKRVNDPIRQVAYEYGNPWDNPVVPPLRLRPQPPLFAAEKLCGTAGVGAFAAGAGAHGGQGQIGMRYVVLTALVPIERQTTAYHEAFDGVTYQIPQNDGGPSYARFNVERVVVPPSGRNHEFDWEAEKPIDSVKAVPAAKRQWQGTDAEVVDPRFLYSQGAARIGHTTEIKNDPLVFPLGPLMDRVWGTEVAHLPEIRFKTEENKGAVRGPQPDEQHPTGDTPDEELPPAKTAAPVPPEEDLNKEPEYVLLRFFDLNVKPGTSYCYRVSLVLNNPNTGINESYLVKPEFGKTRILQSAWSEPSNVVTVPEDVRVLVQSVKTPRASYGEPEGTLTILKWEQDTGMTVRKEFSEISRGKVLNFPKQTPDTSGPKPHGGRLPKVDFMADAVVVDMTGGDSAQMLLLTKGGNLVAHDAAEDSDVLKKFIAAEAAPQVPPVGPGRVRPPSRQPSPDDLERFMERAKAKAGTKPKN